jgi:acylphosphatase
MIKSDASSLSYGSGLSSFDVSYNCLSTIPSEISHFVNLQLLDLSHNQLRSLPDEIGKLVILEYLNISNNPKLETFPQSLANLVKLRLFDITSTGIRCLPASFEIAKLPELTDFRHDLDPSGTPSPGSPTSDTFSFKNESDGVVDIFAQQAEKEKREFLATVAYREAQDEEEQKAFMIREHSNAQDVAQQLKYREMEMEREHKELHRLQDEGNLDVVILII